MSALVHDSPDRAVTAIEPLTRSDNFATQKRLMTSYLKARQVWDVVSGDLQRPDCLFKYAKPITADIPLVEPHLVGAVRQRAIEARLEVSRRSSDTVNGRAAKPRPTTRSSGTCPPTLAFISWDSRCPGTSGMSSKNGTGGWNSPRFASCLPSFAKPLASAPPI
jgi:hypothetical protein